MKSFEKDLRFAGGTGQLLGRLEEVLASMKGVRDVKTVGDAMVTAAIGVSARSWGEVITCRIVPDVGGTARVTVSSRSKVKTTLFDWGANRRNVGEVLRLLSVSGDPSGHPGSSPPE
ncbi:hypothetical protein [Micromonospora sp. SH-82]|uniref:hypothetical protein n=1 Tax=Micromonospora sp. SH-82 TaxID=3132938 RepID=UPI003EBDE506